MSVVQRQDEDGIQTADGWPRGLGGAWMLRPEWRWTGHNGPPWFGAGGAGKLQAWRVFDRRYGLMTW